MRLVLTAVLAITATPASAFTFLFNPPAHFPGSTTDPEVSFVWDGVAPPLKEKDTFRDGVFRDHSDEEAMAAMIGEAMATWSNVAGSYVKLTLVDATTDVTVDRADRINAIHISPTNNLNAAAFANPVLADDAMTIVDCDVTIAPKAVSVEFMLYAITHELGHCLGLGHAHDNYHSIMGYSRTPGNATLGADDKAALIYLYGDDTYGDPKVREAIAAECGAVSDRASPGSGKSLLLALLMLPCLLAVFPSSVRRLVS